MRLDARAIAGGGLRPRTIVARPLPLRPLPLTLVVVSLKRISPRADLYFRRRNSEDAVAFYLPMILDRRMSAFPHLASAALVAAFFAAMLVTANLFTEYKSKLPAVEVVGVKGLTR